MGGSVSTDSLTIWAVAVYAGVWVLAANAVISFFIAFYWQGKVVFMVLAGGAGDEQPYRFARFLNGEFLPELRRKWAKAVFYLVMSMAIFFAAVGLTGL